MRGERGFTLVEIMVVLSVFLVVMGIAYTVLSLNDTYQGLVLVKTELYRQTKVAMDNLIDELQRSQATRAAVVDSNPDEVRFQILLINSIDSEYNVPWGGRQGSTDYPDNSSGFPKFYIHYMLNGTDLVREVLQEASAGEFSGVNGTQQVMASGVTDLQFNQPSSNYIGITADVQKSTTIPVRTITMRLESSAYLRN